MDSSINSEDLRARVLQAVATLPLHNRPDAAAFGEWLAMLPQPVRGAVDELEYTATLTADLQRLTLRAAASPAMLTLRTARYLGAAAAPDDEVEQFALMSERMAPALLGPWLEVSPLGVDGGWQVPVELNLSIAAEFAPPSEALTALLAWADTCGVQHCTGLKRAVGAAAPYTEMVVPLPQGDALHQMTAFLLAAETMGAPTPPESVRRAIMRQVQGPMALSVWLLGEGLGKLGIMLPFPDAELVESLLPTGTDRAALLKFQNALQSSGPAAVEWQYVADGPTVELHYAVLPTLDAPN